MRADALVVIDAQRVFADAGSPWGSPMFPAARPHIASLVAAYGADVVFTRYLPPAQPRGAWVPYFEQWPFALTSPDHQQYQLISEYANRSTVDARTFGKWGEPLRAALGGARSVELAGMATDCCVVSTALAMADAGVQVRVSEVACAGSTPANHGGAIALMALYAPLITIV